MTGTATFTRGADGRLDYREEGQFRLPDGRTLEAERRYIFAGEDGGFVVYFAETPPRLFHRIALRREATTLIGAATHLCGADRYDSRYEFRTDGAFAVEHRVHGPRKCYTTVTHYVRGPELATKVALAARPA